jgi:hypothetical protein
VIKFNSGALFSALLLFGFGMQPAYAASSGGGLAGPSITVDFASLQDTRIPASKSSGGGVSMGGVRVMSSGYFPLAICRNLHGTGVGFEIYKGERELMLAPPDGYTSASIDFVGVTGGVTVGGTAQGARSPRKQVPEGDSTVEFSWYELALTGSLVTIHGASDSEFTVKKLTLK